MKDSDCTTPILLGRAFLKTPRTKIDVNSGTLFMEFYGEIIQFNIYDAMKYPNDDNYVYSIDVVDLLTQQVFELNGKDKLEVAISTHLEKGHDTLTMNIDLQQSIASLNDFSKLNRSGNFSYTPLPISDK